MLSILNDRAPVVARRARAIAALSTPAAAGAKLLCKALRRPGVLPLRPGQSCATGTSRSRCSRTNTVPLLDRWPPPGSAPAADRCCRCCSRSAWPGALPRPRACRCNIVAVFEPRRDRARRAAAAPVLGQPAPRLLLLWGRGDGRSTRSSCRGCGAARSEGERRVGCEPGGAPVPVRGARIAGQVPTAISTTIRTRRPCGADRPHEGAHGPSAIGSGSLALPAACVRWVSPRDPRAPQTLTPFKGHGGRSACALAWSLPGQNAARANRSPEFAIVGIDGRKAVRVEAKSVLRQPGPSGDLDPRRQPNCRGSGASTTRCPMPTCAPAGRPGASRSACRSACRSTKCPLSARQLLKGQPVKTTNRWPRPTSATSGTTRCRSAPSSTTPSRAVPATSSSSGPEKLKRWGIKEARRGRRLQSCSPTRTRAKVYPVTGSASAPTPTTPRRAAWGTSPTSSRALRRSRHLAGFAGDAPRRGPPP